MKRLLIYIALFPLLCCVTSCEKEMMGYQGKEGVYFSVRHNDASIHLSTTWPYQPYSNAEFVHLNKDTVEFPVLVTITGPVKDYDRTFRVEVNPDSTTAILGHHYGELKPEWIIPAGAISTHVNVTLYRVDDLEETAVTLGLRLIATSDFELSFPEWDAIPEFTSGQVVQEFDASLHTLKIHDIMVQPTVWSGSIQAGNRESGLFGVFTRRKMEFMEEYLGVKYEDFASEETMPMVRMILISQDGAAALVKLYDARTPKLEEDGRLMWMGSLPWTSYIGVPWVPNF